MLPGEDMESWPSCELQLILLAAVDDPVAVELLDISEPRQQSEPQTVMMQRTGGSKHGNQVQDRRVV